MSGCLALVEMSAVLVVARKSPDAQAVTVTVMVNGVQKLATSSSCPTERIIASVLFEHLPTDRTMLGPSGFSLTLLLHLSVQPPTLHPVSSVSAGSRMPQYVGEFRSVWRTVCYIHILRQFSHVGNIVISALVLSLST